VFFRRRDDRLDRALSQPAAIAARISESSTAVYCSVVAIDGCPSSTGAHPASVNPRRRPVLNELLLRLEDHKYRWELYEFALTDATERRRVRVIIDHLQVAVHTGGPATNQAYIYTGGSTPPLRRARSLRAHGC
jgi:hypothetical protein